MRRSGPLVLVVVAIVAALLAQLAPAFADKRIALVVGNSRYSNTPVLANPVNDASDVAAALSAIGFEVTLKLDASKGQMDQAVEQFARDATTADAAMFYYAGHGLQYAGRNYVMPVDAKLQDEISLRYELISMDELRDALQRSSGLKIMVLDACRDNPLAARFARSVPVSDRGLPRVQGYARPQQTSGMIIAYATQADDVANDGAGRNSPFSTAFLKEIKEPGLEVGTMFRRVSADVFKMTNGRQAPELSISLLSQNDYYLNQAETDQAIWARIRGSPDADTIREFINRYPNSFFAPDAAARLDLLDREARERAAAAQLAREQQKAAADDARQKAEQEKADRGSKTASDQAEALNARIAALEQRTAEVNTKATAEEQKADEAKKAASEQRTVTAAPIAPALPPNPSDATLTPQIRGELRRLGCYAGADAGWGGAEMKRAIAKYALSAKLGAPPDIPSAALLDDLKGRRDRLCQPDCSAREADVGGRCIAKTCGRGEILSRTGACIARPVAHQEANRVQPSRAPAKGHCFIFNGNNYCN